MLRPFHPCGDRPSALARLLQSKSADRPIPADLIDHPHNHMLISREPLPIDMVLYCPNCGNQHIDVPHGDWTNPPHRSHECQTCEHIWRPADVATNGVASIRTRGVRDSRPPFNGVRK